MRQGSIAKRYAAALISVAQEQKKVDEFYEQLTEINRTFAQNPSLQSALASPVISASKKKGILSALAPKLGISPILGNLLLVLVDNKRIPDLPLITLLYRDMADELKGRVRVQVTSAVPLGSNEPKLKAILEATLKREVLLESKVDPEILGGLVVRVQDRIFNASLRGELNRIKETLTVKAVA